MDGQTDRGSIEWTDRVKAGQMGKAGLPLSGLRASFLASSRPLGTTGTLGTQKPLDGDVGYPQYLGSGQGGSKPH